MKPRRDHRRSPVHALRAAIADVQKPMAPLAVAELVREAERAAVERAAQLSGSQS